MVLFRPNDRVILGVVVPKTRKPFHGANAEKAILTEVGLDGKGRGNESTGPSRTRNRRTKSQAPFDNAKIIPTHFDEFGPTTVFACDIHSTGPDNILVVGKPFYSRS